MARRPRLGFDRFSGLYLWAGIIILFSVWQPSLFPTAATAQSIASQQAIAAMLAIGLLVPLSAGAYDLSIGSTVNLSCILVVVLQTTHHWAMAPAIGLTIALGAAVGVVNGFLVVRLGVSSFIATLGMATIVAAVQTIVSNNSQPLPPTTSSWTVFTQSTIGGFQIVLLYLAAVALLVWWLMEWTPAGRYLYAIGGNQEAARLAGVNTGRYVWLALIISSTVSAVAGVLYASLSGPSLTFGQSLLLPAFAAAFLGSTQIRPGRFNTLGTLIAIFMLATGVQGLQYVTEVQWLSDMFNGVALIVAVAFAAWRQRAMGRGDDARHAPAEDDRGRPALEGRDSR
jgi:ribose transport system permease protein